MHGKSEAEVIIEVNDSLVAISNVSEEKELNSKQLFSRFYKSETTNKSTGLGLAISKAIADKYQYNLQYKYSKKLHIFTIHF